MNVVEKIIAGDVRTAARLIREIEDEHPETRKTLQKLHTHTGNAYVIGITGAPGVGKSTLVDQMIYHLRKQNKTVGVIAVDPTSPFSGGALLGDRVRMQRHSLDKDVFIRSLAARCHAGGLSVSTQAVIDVLDAMGKDIIIVETVGVGQGEIDVVKSAHTTIVVVIPGMGDEIQAFKAGILEIGQIFLINKSDGAGADQTLENLKAMIALNQHKLSAEGWVPPVLMAEAVHNKGVAELLHTVEDHRQHVDALSFERKYRHSRERAATQFSAMIKNRLVEDVLKQLSATPRYQQAVDAIARGTKDPYSACDDLLSAILKISLEREE
jgi:LAO/AO transport system kinase